jgi:hypothetical protein
MDRWNRADSRCLVRMGLLKKVVCNKDNVADLAVAITNSAYTENGKHVDKGRWKTTQEFHRPHKAISK